MAKRDQIGFIEQHLEKVVLGVTALGLVVVLVFWVTRSPRRIELVGSIQSYGPDQVDQGLREQAERLRAILNQAPPPEKPPPDYGAVMAALRVSPYDPYHAPRIVNDIIPLTEGRAPLEAISPGESQARGALKLADLLPLPAPEKPLVRIEREVQIPQSSAAAPAASEALRPVEVVAAHGAGVFPQGKMLERWRKVVEQASLPVAMWAAAVEVQRSQLLPDGRWSSPGAVSRLPGEFTPPALPPYEDKNLPEIRQVITELSQPAIQEYILEPEYPQIIWPGRQMGTWMIHKPRTRVSNLSAGAGVTPGEGMYLPVPSLPQTYYSTTRPGYGPAYQPPLYRPDGMPPVYRPESQVPVYRPDMPPPVYRPEAPPVPGVPTTPPRIPLPRAPVAPTPLPRAPVAPTPLPRAPVAPTPLPRAPIAPTPLPRAPIAPPPLPPPVSEALAPSAPEVAAVLPLAQQIEHPDGIMEVWFHDTGNLVEGQSYRYRYRVVLLNPLALRFRDVANEADAKVLTLTTEWSPWSDAQTVHRPTRFFVVGHSPQTQIVGVEVFTQKWGQRVHWRFNVARGEPIGSSVTMDMLPLVGEKVEAVSVDFSTGAVAVDFDFEKRVRRPNTQVELPTAEMLYLDADGRLRTRTQSEDEGSKEYDALKREAAETARAVEAAKTAGAYRSP